MITIKTIPSYVCYTAVCSKGEKCAACKYSQRTCKTQNQKWLNKRTEEDMILTEACMGESDSKNTQANEFLEAVLAGRALVTGYVLNKNLTYGVRKATW